MQRGKAPSTVTHPDKLYFPTVGISKRDYMQYLAQMGTYLLRHLRHRPVSLVRCPDGVHGRRFFQRHVPPHAPPGLPARAQEGERALIAIPDVETLMYYGNLGAIEFHAGLHLVDGPAAGLPTALTFDLDPSLPGDFERARELALCLREVLCGLGLDGIAKTTGASGLQIFVPLDEPVPYLVTRPVVQFIAAYCASQWPNLATVERRVRERGHRVYVDAPQHGPTRTLIAAYSVRAVDHALVSVPLTWQELEQGAKPLDFPMPRVPERVARLGDLLAEIPRQPSSLVRQIHAELPRAWRQTRVRSV
ncbi:non-homologous end-joining DNA ligase [Alicyclobacillus vulcanalis]|uniref:Bifunctional non-homologous end joining protein LigD n=1 Tax=Alicyclobacillus vulcanalis TaxID=252246 RepID=A0A1N7NET9_9BACL|nr:non-homologous end-joining DNA ligase [Alicyclobacillus vulcanalis]SIS96816.1 bifunctional non-homologous end joining protein LigD [Alicyclobacillus vulcanalis]